MKSQHGAMCLEKQEGRFDDDSKPHIKNIVFCKDLQFGKSGIVILMEILFTNHHNPHLFM
jgi:hypothetical protein